ncbi:MULTISPECIES: serine hydrolase domain-containing protein [Rhizobium/Agrobacterium group]|uniref:serine hydrolase domain-containing protein n=1 Tax=Rhizobium/Agrobacterium group TaxID=227290 RepID=UPI0012E78E4E|nr:MULTISPECIES: serine hydrolase domain-containing protein [Rhizobium/Agrobacterium group]MCF1473852.1 beta-lactamase family protein [Allorhizobium ampelinum]MVA50060.1 serine hydrolase [Agrobacterium vitis]NSZ51038.1 beta-lactamase family protein [Agrobacterium vitis]NTA33039.1 beta-lactamase family protein [Agrobacterium vitis]
MSIVERVNRVLEEAVSSEALVGAVVMVFRHGQPLLRRAIGYADREARIPVRLDTIFRFASVTKPFVAATALSLIDKGLLGLDDLVADHLPWFRPKTPAGTFAAITVRHLLTHTSGLTYDPALQRLPRERAINLGLLDTDLTVEENFSRHNAIPLAFAPGERWGYSVSTDLLGAVVAKVHGERRAGEQGEDDGAAAPVPGTTSTTAFARYFGSIEGRNLLEAAVVEHVCEPMRLTDARFRVTDMARLAVPYRDGEHRAERMEDQWRSTGVSGEGPAFSPSRIFNPRAFQSGGGGMAGTALDVLTLLETIRTGGGGLMSPELARMCLSNQIGDLPMGLPGKRFSFLGAVITDSAAAATALPPGAVQWGGVYGNTWFIIPEAGLTVVSLSNTALEGCDGAYVERLRAAVCATG